MSRRQLDYYFRYARRLFANLPKRAYLTLRYQGVRETLFRVVTFPLRLTPLGAKLGLSARLTDPSGPARAWYRKNWRPAAVVIPTYGPADLVAAAVKSIRKTTQTDRVRIIVCDDGSAPEHVAALRALEGIELVEGAEQAGFAANCNRGLTLVRANEDAVLLNSDVVAEPGWLEVLQHAAHRATGPRTGVVGGKLLYPDGTIQFGGTVRNQGAPEWFDHRFRFKPADFPPANVMQPALAVTGACMYITRACLDEVGVLDEAYGMAYEDVDYCLRVWEAGRRVVYAPAATLVHFESKTRGMVQGGRELESQRLFWERWGDWFDKRDVRSKSQDGLKVIYVTQDCGVGGGHRVVFEHLHGLADRGHEVELWTLDENPPDWFELRVPMRSFAKYPDLADALAGEDAIKVATWWETAPAVWEASVCRGIAAYFVQDLETSYYTDEVHHAAVLTWYRPEFRYMTTSSWVHDQLQPLVGEAVPISPGIDLEAFSDRGLERHEDVVMAVGRTNPLKNFPLTRDAFKALPGGPKLWLFGIEPKVAHGIERVDYRIRPSDAEIAEMMGTCTVFLQTSKHEGFCLPILEAMASGTPIVCTDADGNRDFCEDGVNCLMPAAEAGAVRDALQRVLTDPELRARLVAGGHRTAAAHAWPERLDAVERWFASLAE
jgi:GT2 family glycosyltransferase